MPAEAPYLTDLLRCVQQGEVDLQRKAEQRAFYLRKRRQRDADRQKAAGSQLRWKSYSSLVVEDAPGKDEMRRVFNDFLNQVMVMLGDSITSEEVHATANFIYMAAIKEQSEASQLAELVPMFGRLDAKSYRSVASLAKRLHEWREEHMDPRKRPSSSKSSSERTKKQPVVREYGVDQRALQLKYSPSPILQQQQRKSAGRARRDVKDVKVEVVSTGTGRAPVMTARNWVDAARGESMDPRWLYRQCVRHLSATPEQQGTFTPERLAATIFQVFIDSKNDAALSNSLCEVIGFSNMEFIELLIQRKIPLTQVAVEGVTGELMAAVEGGASAAKGEGVPSYGCGFTINTAHDKKLEKQKRKYRRKIAAHQQERGPVSEEEAFYTQHSAATAAYLQEPGTFTVPLMESRAGAEQIVTASGAIVTSSEGGGAAKKGLPPGTKTKKCDGYIQHSVPYQNPPPFEDDERLIPIGELPPMAQKAFKGYKSLNRIQSKICNTALTTNENLLICAPTGAGKTNVALLTMLHEILNHYDEASGVVDIAAFKIVYVAPMKALAQEMTETFSRRLGDLGQKIVVKEYTGDMSLTKKQLAETHVIVTTPEKWDVTTRKTTGDAVLVQSVKLIILDEVHLLHEDRGPVIETIIARTQRQVERSQAMVRIVGLSATLPNFIDVALFLRVNPTKGLFYFDGRYRPVPLSQQYIGVNGASGGKNVLGQKKKMNEIAYTKAIESIRKGNQVMIFVHSRKDTVKTGQAVMDIAAAHNTLDEFSALDKLQAFQTQLQRSRNKELKELLDAGFACHHAGMLRSDRNLVEKMFMNGAVNVLVCTATLAWGVNLPAQTVVIKGTQIYSPKVSSFVDLSMLDVMQIFGRAGRPQFDKSGEGIIITSEDKLPVYLRLLNQQMPIESQFISRLADNLNAEVNLGTVTTMKEAIDWLSYTYLYVRIVKNPTAYGISPEQIQMDPDLFRHRRKLIEDACATLDRAQMLRYSKQADILSSTKLGRVASHYYIEHETIETFNECMKKNENMEQRHILAMVCQAHEFENVMIREEEMKELATLHEKACHVEVIGGHEKRTGKVNVLLQAYISHYPITSFSMISDTSYVIQNISRILRALFEIAVSNCSVGLAYEALLLCKIVERRQWDFQHDLRQFGPAIKPILLQKLERKNLGVEELADMEDGEIGQLLSHPRAGSSIAYYVRQLPYLEMNATVQPITRTVLRVRLDLIPSFQWNDKFHGTVDHWWIWVDDGHRIYHTEYFLLHKEKCKEKAELCFTIPISDPVPSQYIIRAVNDRWLGSESEFALSFKHLILPEQYPAHTELLPLQPLPKSAVHDKEHEKIFRFSHFNSIQTQVFHTLMHTDHNVLLGAPTGSGKTVSAEVAILRLFNCHPKKKVVYIAPLKALVKERIRDWREKFGRMLGKRVEELTGDVTPNIQALRRADIVLTTPEKWDGISRNWQQRSYVQDVGLVVIDEIHMLGQDRGPILEVIVSRMRYISSKISTVCRIVGLSTALANARDLASWLGITNVGLYNFNPATRPVPVEIHISGYPGKHYCPRMATMNKPTYQAIRQYSPTKPVLVFVSSRRQTRLTALDIINFAVADDPTQFLHMDHGELAEVTKTVKDSNLRHVLSYGIGMHHAGLAESDRSLVEKLFLENKIQLLVSTSTLAWGVNLPAHLVVVKGTEYFDAKECKYVDFPITDLLQMVGRAGRPQFDTEAVAVVLVEESKKNFYKKFLYEPFPVESSLSNCLHDHINAEIVAGTISSKQDAIDYLTWTYFFTRILKNPSYYGVESTDSRAVNIFLSDKVASTLQDLEEATCIKMDGDAVEATTMGYIGSYYYLSYESIFLFGEEITAGCDVEALLGTLTATAEFDELPVRHNEDLLNEELAGQVPLEVDDLSYDDPHTKTHLLLQAYFSHLDLPIPDFYTDTKSVLDQAVRVLQAMVDVAAEGGWLSTTLSACHLFQMLMQGRWHTDSSLLTLPHLSAKVRDELQKSGFWSVRDIQRGDTKKVLEVLSHHLKKRQLDKFKQVMGQIPFVAMTVDYAGKVLPGSEVTVEVKLVRHSKVTNHIYSSSFPKRVTENWWLLLADELNDELLALRRVHFEGGTRASLTFLAPEQRGTHSFSVQLVCGSYLGTQTRLN